MVWDGFNVIDIKILNVSTIDQNVNAIKELQVKYNVNNKLTIVDEDGVGGGVKDYLNCTGFVNNSKPKRYKGKEENFASLKDQCLYHLAEKVNRNEMYVNCAIDIETLLTEELEHVRLPKEIDTSRIRLKNKDAIKKDIGRSPDYSDALMMRMYFDIVNVGEYKMYFI
jgi:hypothetical protein